MQLIANKSMRYATRRLAAGDLFTASAKDARILTALKRARAVDNSQPFIPNEWQDLDWPALKALAASISAGPIKTKADATAAIEAEIQRRGA